MTIDELDLDLLTRQFGAPIPGEAPVTPKDHAVRLLGEYRDAEPITPPASGEELWFGRSYGVNADTTSGEGFVYVRLRPGAGFSTGLEPESGQEEADAQSLLDAVMGGKPAPAGNASLRYMRGAEPKEPFAPLVKTGGKSMAVSAKSPFWLRRKGNRMLLIERWSPHSANRRTPFHGAGRYAELWKVP